MNKITYSSLKLKTNTDFKTVEGTNIEVLKYLPTEDKVALINIALQNSKDGFVYNTTLLDAYFHLYIVFMYSNISFTDKQKEDPLKLYDALKSSGLLDKIIMTMDEEEYTKLNEYLNQQEVDNYNYNTSIMGTIKTMLDQLPEKAEEMQKIMSTFDPNKFQNVINFAKSANGGRDI